MLVVTPIEARWLLQGKTDGVTRRWDECKYKERDEVIIATFDGSHLGYAIVKSVRPGTVDQCRSDDELAKKDGFTNAMSWWNHFREHFGPANGKTFHIQFDMRAIHAETAQEIARQ